eukprot:CAMPEP_0202480560 /NCGR_PEP_ID=MMETSP1361-20130828/497_1 /ASSEMBLY_ACC=CAM_ASM_000849 /TAXON_ID=210615 /ORGANISM="Staurosira complex sp., Strain CCMP2646" /LENGTH=791 /DNA_ID=CAMNT_0049108003 /DNA_START=427 /DNA_END=2802 /DNA_ORIENTATION=+
MQGTLVDVPSSTLASESAKEVRDSLAAASPHRPPMTVVVIQESSESPGTLNNDNSQHSRPWQPPPTRSVSLGSTEGKSRSESASSSISPNCFSSFKLKPRKPVPFGSNPVRSGRPSATGSPRGRKRPANSISIPIGSVSSAGSPPRPPRPFCAKDDRSDASSAKEATFSPDSDSTRKQTSLSPPTFDMDCLNLNSLSIHSPSKTSPPSYRGNPHGVSRARASSFSMYGYGASPVGSVTRAAMTSTSESTNSSFMGTPSSSAWSSPRHVPLTVLSSSQTMSPSMNSLVRPPLHGGESSLLFSLDNDDDQSDDMGFPMKLPSSTSCNSSISSSGDDYKIPMYSSQRLAQKPPAMFSSPRKTTTLSPRTPLPRVMLTPRTPKSTGSRRQGVLPMFPSPSEDDISSTPQTNQSSIDDAMEILLDGLAKRGHPGRFHATTDYIHHPSEEVPKMLIPRHHDSTNSLAYSLTEGSRAPAANRNEQDSFLPPVPLSETPPPTLESDIINRSPPALPKAWLLPVPSNSTIVDDRHNNAHENDESHLSPSIERSAGFDQTTREPSARSIPVHESVFKDMMSVNARERSTMADCESLSDSCDEDEFVLSLPVSNKSHEIDETRPKKQIRRDSYDSGASTFINGRHESSTSLASGLASASSLFGMEFYQDETHSATSPHAHRSSTPFLSRSNHTESFNSSFGALSSHEGEGNDSFVPLGIHHRARRSEHSFGSIGLSLEGHSSAVDDQGRDLVTPPATRQQVAFSPPLLVSQSDQADCFCLTPKYANKGSQNDNDDDEGGMFP